jgi:mannose-6-phosphate isomerase-like protein (cupin superfamily)
MRKYVGQRIKALREAQDMNLEDVARLAGIAPERLKAYEDGSAVPAIGAVIQLSRVLGSKTEGLLLGGAVVSEQLTICRAGEGMAGDQGDTEQSYTYLSLTRPGTEGHRMEPFLLTFDPAAPAPVPITHDGQEFCYVLEGRITFTYDGRNFILEPGDSVYHDATHPHAFHGLGPTPAKMLAVVSS